MTGISPGLLDKEIKLRIAQADDALAEIRRQRRIVTGLVMFKKLNVSGSGQKKNTRIRSLFRRFNNKTEHVAERYRAAHQALLCADPDGDWQSRLQELHPEDIRGPGKEDSEDGRRDMSERLQEPSWIWLVPRVETVQDIGIMEEHLDANLRAEWAKSRARAARWTEEVTLLTEEMRRTLTFFELKARWWRSHVYLRLDVPDDVRHGIDAYAERQAALLEQRAVNYAQYWLSALKAKGVTPCWEVKYFGTSQVETNEAAVLTEGGSDDDGENSENEEGDITENTVHDDFETGL